MNKRKVLVEALALALAVWSSTATATTSIQVKPDSLLAVEQNRSTIIDGIVATWGTQLELSGAGLSRDQLRSMLENLRADQLLAASVAGSLSGLRNVLSNAVDIQYTPPSRLTAKALGDATQDMVYTPVVPCRIVDTRIGAGGVFLPQTQRDWVAYSPSGFASQGGSATNCGIPLHPAAVMVNTTLANTVGGPEFVTLWPSNQTRPLASTVNWWASGTAAGERRGRPAMHGRCLHI